MNAQERLNYLLETIVTPTNTGVTLAMIEDTVGHAAWPLVRLTLQSATVPASDSQVDQLIAVQMGDALAALRSATGLLLSPQIRQDMIDLLASRGSWPDSVRDAIKALGVSRQARWQQEGYETEPKLELVTKQLIVSEGISRVSARHTASKAWLDSFEVANKTAEQVQSFVDSIVNSEDGNPPPNPGGE